VNVPRILVAGVGNIFLGDDAFGVEVTQHLAQRNLPEEVRVVDFGIRGLDLTYALLDGYETVILVDALRRGETPGTLYVIEPSPAGPGESRSGDLLIDGHNMDPAKVLRLAVSLGAEIKRVLLVGCEPTRTTAPEEMQMKMSEPVRAAVPEAVVLIESLLTKVLRGKGTTQEKACTSFRSP